MSDLKIAVISDIHGNLWALDAVLADIEKRETKSIVNLGDSLYGPFDPAATADRLIDLSIPSILGNQDRVSLSPPPASSHTLEYVNQSLSPRHFDWLKSLPVTDVMYNQIFLCHGTPDSDEVYLTEDMSKAGARLRDPEHIMADLVGVEQEIVLCGHSHIPRTVYLPNGKLVVNPGSIGLPAYWDDVPRPHIMESGCPHAKYAILARDSGAWLVEHLIVPYDWQIAAKTAEENNRSDWAKWIASGRAPLSRRARRRRSPRR